MTQYKVWIHIEKITNVNKDNEAYEDIGMPEIAGEVNTYKEATQISNDLLGLAVMKGYK